MKVIGLIGGMSWESSLEYYRLINQGIKSRLGGLHSARSLMYSVDFEEIEILQHRGQWNEATEIMVDAALRIERGGADCVVICTNTMHRMADEVKTNVGIPLLHIADATAEKIKSAGLGTIGLLGTKFTMEQDFYKGRLSDLHNITVITPSEIERNVIHDVIYGELCLGDIKEGSRSRFIKIIEGLMSKGAEGIVLGCTEIPLLVRAEDAPIPLFDTTRIHADYAVDFALR
ncbi:aspartate/glutamate racemase family protein [Acidobacteriota bacterium]